MEPAVGRCATVCGGVHAAGLTCYRCHWTTTIVALLLTPSGADLWITDAPLGGCHGLEGYAAGHAETAGRETAEREWAGGYGERERSSGMTNWRVVTDSALRHAHSHARAEDDRDAIAAPQLPGPSAHPRGGRAGAGGWDLAVHRTAWTNCVHGALEPHYGYDYTLPAFGLLDCLPFGAIVGQGEPDRCVATWPNWQRLSHGLPPLRGEQIGQVPPVAQRRAPRSATTAPAAGRTCTLDARPRPRRSQRAVSPACGGGLGAAGMNQDPPPSASCSIAWCSTDYSRWRYLVARATVADVPGPAPGVREPRRPPGPS